VSVFDLKPDDFNPKISVSAVFIEVGDEVLFLRRSPDVPQGDTWAIPGGKLKLNEKKEAAALREVKE